MQTSGLVCLDHHQQEWLLRDVPRHHVKAGEGRQECHEEGRKDREPWEPGGEDSPHDDCEVSYSIESR